MYAMNVPFKKMVECAKIPTHNIMDAGLDFYAAEEVVIRPGESKAVSTGVAWDGMSLCTDFEMPVLIMKSRSGLAFKMLIEASNAGVIDAGYTGVIKVLIHNNSETPMNFGIGGKMAQGIVFMIPYVQATEVFELPETERGENGFGSTGVK